MKKAVLIALALTTLVGSPALAADLSRPAPAYKAPPPPPAPIFTWTGFYLGGERQKDHRQLENLKLRQKAEIEFISEA